MKRPNITPGPWFVSRKNQSRVIASGPKAETLAKAFAKGVTAEIEKREFEANARAIAALPALLEALEAMLEAYAPYHQQTVEHRGGEDSLHSSVNKARSALIAAGYQF